MLQIRRRAGARWLSQDAQDTLAKSLKCGPKITLTDLHPRTSVHTHTHIGQPSGPLAARI